MDIFSLLSNSPTSNMYPKDFPKLTCSCRFLSCKWNFVFKLFKLFLHILRKPKLSTQSYDL